MSFGPGQSLNVAFQWYSSFLCIFVASQIPVSHSSPVFLVTPMTKNTYFLLGLLDLG